MKTPHWLITDYHGFTLQVIPGSEPTETALRAFAEWGREYASRVHLGVQFSNKTVFSTIKTPEAAHLLALSDEMKREQSFEFDERQEPLDI